MGAQIDVVDAYRTIMPENKAETVSRMLEAGEDPEEIEKTMPELSDMGGSDFVSGSEF